MIKLFQRKRRFYFNSMSSNKNSSCWTLYGHDPTMLHFMIPLLCFVGKCFLVCVVFKVYLYRTNTSVLWRSVIGFTHETVLAFAVCKYSIAVVIILEVNQSKIKHRKSQLLGACYTCCSFNLSGKRHPYNTWLQARASWNAKLLM